jgi:hypothetical protein
MDSSSERRMLIRSSWANHPRSRNGGGDGDGGAGTSRTVVRFIMGQPRKTWERRVRVEMERTYRLTLIASCQAHIGMPLSFSRRAQNTTISLFSQLQKT